MNSVLEFVRLLRMLGVKLRRGGLSRAPLKIVRLAVENDTVHCDWVLRPADVLDRGLSDDWRGRRVALEALTDALAVRDLVFATIASARFGELRAFSERDGQERILMIRGSVSRDQEPGYRTPSLTMRALSCGFRFRLQNGLLEPLDSP